MAYVEGLGECRKPTYDELVTVIGDLLDWADHPFEYNSVTDPCWERANIAHHLAGGRRG